MAPRDRKVGELYVNACIAAKTKGYEWQLTFTNSSLVAFNLFKLFILTLKPLFKQEWPMARSMTRMEITASVCI